MIKSIVTNKKKLSQLCVPVPADKINKVVTDLLNTMDRHRAKAHGLAANQIGYNYRAFVMKNSQGNLIPFVNPKIIFMGGGKSHNYEGCLSRPNDKPVWKSRFKLVRFVSKNLQDATIEGFDYNKPFWHPANDTGVWSFKNLFARIIQHEMNHLEGRLV